MLKNQLLMGTDPELFAKDASGKYVSIHDRLPGTKAEPFRVDRGAVQVDGTAAEFNIDPADNEDDFVTNIDTVMKILQEMVGSDLQLAADPVAEYGRAYMKTLPESALELGCEPDYNAYTGQENTRPNADVDYRTGAGHIHFGWGANMPINHPEHMKACCMLTKQLDIALGLRSLFFDDNSKRRELYGKAGAFRPKHYGMEYRVLSNSWVGNKGLTRNIYRAAQEAFHDLVRGHRYSHTDHALWAINEGNKRLAKDILDLNGLERF